MTLIKSDLEDKMRIIDKNQDFYDYLQDSTDTLVFDRRNSFLLTKEYFCRSLSIYRYRDSKYRFILLQCGSTFWLFIVTITKCNSYGSVEDYEVELLTTWKNYDKSNELLKLDMIQFKNSYKMYEYRTRDFVYDRIKENVDDLVSAINRNDFSVETNMNKYINYVDYKCSYKKEEKTLPLLKACGIGNILDPQQIFCAIEEYFSTEKMKLETTEAKGTTNDDKITMHGFDTKTSFRNNK